VLNSAPLHAGQGRVARLADLLLQLTNLRIILGPPFLRLYIMLSVPLTQNLSLTKLLLTIRRVLEFVTISFLLGGDLVEVDLRAHQLVVRL